MELSASSPKIVAQSFAMLRTVQPWRAQAFVIGFALANVSA
jgi:hypothetical protein